MSKPPSLHPLFAVRNAARTLATLGMTHYEFCVLEAIANRGNSETGACWASQATLGDDSLMSRRTVQRALDGLQRLQERSGISLLQLVGKGRKGVEIWRVDLTSILELTAQFNQTSDNPIASPRPLLRLIDSPVAPNRPTEASIGPAVASNRLEIGPIDAQSAFDSRIDPQKEAQSGFTQQNAKPPHNVETVEAKKARRLREEQELRMETQELLRSSEDETGTCESDQLE